MEQDYAIKLLNNHPSDYLLFGTDSPWTDQKKALDILISLKLV